jgi:hypothetical protein
MAAAYPHVRVRVINAGVPLCGTYETDPATGRARLVVHERGETYETCCPFCHEKRYRLWVNHMFGTRDPKLAWPHIELWKCFNTDCQSDFENRKELEDLVLMLDGVPVVKFESREGGPRELEPCEFPGTAVPLVAVPAHAGAAYLRGRNFDIAELTATWGVMVAVHVPPRTRGAAAQGRIVIPVRRGGQMIGWQARYPGDLDWKSAGVVKYLTYFPKSLAVYGTDEAAGSPYVVAVEGATDVWRHGPGAVSCLGKGASPIQVRILARNLNGRTLVTVPDGNDPESAPAFDKMAAAVVRVQRAEGLPESRVGTVELAVGTDPGGTDRRVLRDRVAAAVDRALVLAPPT